ncbi:MAG: preprotein translocase subunit SecY [Clostridia bacterium]|nr:preprotein translocase subunit SecY [Clostridia bacterium]
MFQTLKNAWKIMDLRKKLLFTLLIVLLYRLGAQIPVPYISQAVFEGAAAQFTGILEYMDFLAGGALSQATLFALSVNPYITASIVIQLLTIAIPALERLSKEGEEGRKKINKITRYVTIGLALVTSYGYMKLLNSYGYFTHELSVFEQIVVVACYCAGASLVMWLAEKINEVGIGNGISMILFANIISRGPDLVMSLWNMVVDSKYLAVGIVLGVVSIVITLAVVVLVVLVTNSERKIPIQYAKRVVGRKMYGGQNTSLPIKINMSGVMPIIFAGSIVSIPATIASFFPKQKWLVSIAENFSYDSWFYIVVYLLLIVAFSYFYIMISFNPVEVANNIKNNGGAIPGVRTGRPTVDFITKILNRITMIGGIFLCFIAGFPMIINAAFNGSFSGIAFGGSSLLIVVGVALETVRDLEAQITLRNYKGFLD